MLMIVENLAGETIAPPSLIVEYIWWLVFLNTYILIIHLFHELSASVLEIQDV